MRQIVTQQCEHCNFTLESISDMKDHEEKCKYNKDNKRCFSCSHFIINTKECDLGIENKQFLLLSLIPCLSHKN